MKTGLQRQQLPEHGALPHSFLSPTLSCSSILLAFTNPSNIFLAQKGFGENHSVSEPMKSHVLQTRNVGPGGGPLSQFLVLGLLAIEFPLIHLVKVREGLWTHAPFI